MTTSLNSFTGVVLCATQGADYEIRLREPGHAVTVAVLQGGQLAPGLVELAEALAGDDLNLFAFVAHDDRSSLRVSPLRASEARLDQLIAHSTTVLSLATCEDAAPCVRLGGRDAALREALSEKLTAAGFQAEPSAVPGADLSSAYFFNRAAEGGVQIELSPGLRAHLDQDGMCRGAFVAAVRAAIQGYLAAQRSDLARTLDRFERATAQFPASIRTGPGRREDSDARAVPLSSATNKEE